MVELREQWLDIESNNLPQRRWQSSLKCGATQGKESLFVEIYTISRKKKHRRKVLSWSSNPFTNKHLHLVTARHWRAGRTLYNASLCCDYTTASPTPNWQALSAGSMLGMGLGGVCVCVCVYICVCEGGRVRYNYSHRCSKSPKTGSSVLSVASATPPLPLCRSLPPTETSISSPPAWQQICQPPPSAPSLHTVSEGWFSRKQTV